MAMEPMDSVYKGHRGHGSGDADQSEITAIAQKGSNPNEGGILRGED